MSEHCTPAPPKDYTANGLHFTGDLRLRPTWFFGLCVLEERVEHIDGRASWVRVRHPTEIEAADAFYFAVPKVAQPLTTWQRKKLNTTPAERTKRTKERRKRQKARLRAAENERKLAARDPGSIEPEASESAS